MPIAARHLEVEGRPILDELLLSRGDVRLALDSACGLNDRGYAPRAYAAIENGLVAVMKFGSCYDASATVCEGTVP